jgi:hypothetical protein
MELIGGLAKLTSPAQIHRRVRSTLTTMTDMAYSTLACSSAVTKFGLFTKNRQKQQLDNMHCSRARVLGINTASRLLMRDADISCS